MTDDGKVRCPYVDLNDPLYVRYHDEEWCRESHDEHYLYEMFVLELFQAGLSWKLLLHKRENFRRAYDGFDVKKVAAYDEQKVQELLHDKGIIRSEAKIRASISNSRIFMDIEKECGSFDEYIWGFSGGRQVHDEPGLTKSELSDAVSADLKRRGVKFAGSVTIYSYLQAIGVIDSHSRECFCYHGRSHCGRLTR
ncbi:MAG: DNA-3-methyladenine glycosylase I [Anaerovoracaceae bacterium]|jgi:DNA-3-methyladenine glycosylase I